MMPGASTALVVGALRWLDAGDAAEVNLTLDELPEEDIDSAVALCADLLERLRRRREVALVRTEAASRR